MSEQLSASWWLWLVCVTAGLSVACGNSENPTISSGAGGGAGAAAGAGGSASGAAGTTPASTPPGTRLAWDSGGFVASDHNPFGIQGPFYFYSDCDPPSGLPCTAPDPSLVGADGKPGWSVDANAACVKGTAVKVQQNMFSAQWGAGLALDLNSKGGEPGAPASKGTFDLAGAKIRGFSVDIAGSAPAQIRINLTMPGLADSNFVPANVPGTTTFDLSQAKQGTWVTTKTPLDASQVEALQFQVFTVATSPTPYDFCVTAIRAIAEDGP
jgi:hypothetical protein